MYSKTRTRSSVKDIINVKLIRYHVLCLETKLRGWHKRVNLSVNKQFQLSTHCLIYKRTCICYVFVWMVVGVLLFLRKVCRVLPDVGERKWNFVLRRDRQRDTRQSRCHWHSEGRNHPDSDVPRWPADTQWHHIPNTPALWHERKYVRQTWRWIQILQVECLILEWLYSTIRNGGTVCD